MRSSGLQEPSAPVKISHLGQNMPTSAEVKEFYDDFSKTTLLRDFRYPNARLQAIKRLCDRFVPHGARVLEIGCGTGIISKYLLRRAAHIVATDISEIGIAIAKMYLSDRRCEFRALNIVDEQVPLEVGEKFDTILIFDVLEHIPKEKRALLFARIEERLAPNGFVLITTPSPEYQEYLKRHKPAVLQVIDETVWLADVLTVTKLQPIYFSYVDAGEKNQYNHLVLAPISNYTSIVLAPGILGRIIRFVKKIVWRSRNWAFLRRVNNAFEKK